MKSSRIVLVGRPHDRSLSSSSWSTTCQILGSPKNMVSFPALEKHLKDPESWWCQFMQGISLETDIENVEDLVVNQALLFLRRWCFFASE